MTPQEEAVIEVAKRVVAIRPGDTLLEPLKQAVEALTNGQKAGRIGV